MAYGSAPEQPFADAPAGLRAGAPRERRRAFGEAGERRQRAGVRGALRALSPADLPLLPLDPPQRRGCPGCAAVDVRRGAWGAAARSAQRAIAPMALPDRAQRDDLTAASPRSHDRAFGVAGAGERL